MVPTTNTTTTILLGIMFLFLLLSLYVTCPIESLYVHWPFSWSFSSISVCFPRKKKICREKIEKNIESSLLVREDHNNNHVSGGRYTAANSGSAATADSCGGFRHLDCCLWILCFWSCCDYYYYFDNLRVRKVFFFFGEKS